MSRKFKSHKALKHYTTRKTKQAEIAGLGVADALPVPTGEWVHDKEHECNFILIRLSSTECQLAHNTSPKITIIKYFYLSSGFSRIPRTKIVDIFHNLHNSALFLVSRTSYACIGILRYQLCHSRACELFFKKSFKAEKLENETETDFVQWKIFCCCCLRSVKKQA